MNHDFSQVPVARSFVQRLIGLMGRRDRLSLFIPSCASVHTWFMRSPIDIVFVDGNSLVLEIRESANPWGTHFGPRGTRAVLEIPPGSARQLGLTSGDSVTTASV